MKRYLTNLVIIALGSLIFYLPNVKITTQQLNSPVFALADTKDHSANSTNSTTSTVAQNKATTVNSDPPAVSNTSATPNAVSTASTTATTASSVTPTFNPNDPSTWPTCPTGDIVWASNGTCHPPAVNTDVSSSSVTETNTTVVNYASGCSTYASDFEQYSWDSSIAMAICMAESGGNPDAVSPTNDYGLMQIHDGLDIYGTQIYDPSFNISIAYQKYVDQGWHAWTTYTTGAFERYMN
jgi:hypothetical protein